MKNCELGEVYIIILWIKSFLEWIQNSGSAVGYVKNVEMHTDSSIFMSQPW